MMKTCHSILAGLCLATIAGCGANARLAITPTATDVDLEQFAGRDGE